MSKNEIKSKEQIVTALQKIFVASGIQKRYLFGSFIKGKKYNDIDVVIDPPKNFTLLDLARLGNKIEEKVGLPVDIVTFRSMDSQFRKNIEKEMTAI